MACTLVALYIMNYRRWRKIILVSLLSGITLSIAAIFICNAIITNAAKGKLFSDAQSLPYNKAGLLLGTGKFLGSGATNPYYQYRIDAATALIRAGKVSYLVISGDNSRKDYNEPQQMKDDLVKNGIDSTVIFLDYAGFRTFDSMIRLKEIFGQTSVTVISQPFHNERAIYIASRNGIAAIGYNARDVSQDFGWKVQLREKLARVKVFVDNLINTKPKYLGDPVILPE